MATPSRGLEADPEYRKARARKAALAAHSTDTLINRLADRAATLTAEQAERLRSLLVEASR